jgi:hypothetical protein
MPEKHLNEPRWVAVKDRLPKPGQFVRYRTKDFAAAGRCDTNGKWTTAQGHPEGSEVLEWMEL